MVGGRLLRGAYPARRKAAPPQGRDRQHRRERHANHFRRHDLVHADFDFLPRRPGAGVSVPGSGPQDGAQRDRPRRLHQAVGPADGRVAARPRRAGRCARHLQRPVARCRRVPVGRKDRGAIQRRPAAPGQGGSGPVRRGAVVRQRQPVHARPLRRRHARSRPRWLPAVRGLETAADVAHRYSGGLPRMERVLLPAAARAEWG
mmetsp:Transcript_5130/g.16720  ORF Transcript_5130/g.16720 Transcript_5130/m.16720 type:complete len:203 (-) Transcript_5130:1013-1621(-)